MATYGEIKRQFEEANPMKLRETLTREQRVIEFLERRLNQLNDAQLGDPAPDDAVAAMEIISQLALVIGPILPSGGCIFPAGRCGEPVS
jgi:hypothetical protein